MADIPHLMGDKDDSPLTAAQNKLLTRMRGNREEARSAWDVSHFDLNTVEGASYSGRGGSLLSAWKMCGRQYKGFQWDRKPRRGLA